MKKKIISQNQIMEILEKCYETAINGLPSSKSCQDLADEYLNKYIDRDLAIKKMVTAQIAKCTTSGFLTSLGGIMTLPVAIPANIGSVLYVQLRMIATIATIGGYNTNDDEVQTLVYLCLTGTSITEICKSTGVQLTNKLTLNALKKLPSNILTKINKKVGFRLFTKFGETGAINLSKMIPIAGGVIGGGLDLTTTTIIYKKAHKTFILNEID